MRLPFAKLELFSRSVTLVASALLAALSWAQVHTFAGNPQHTSVYPVAAQHMNQIKWVAQMNENLTGGFAHYGSMLVTENNTVILMVRTLSNGYDLVAYDGATGAQKYRIATDYAQTTGAVWLLPVQPVVVNTGSGFVLYYPGAGGTVWRLNDPDTSTPGTPTRIVFYGTEADYLANQTAFNGAINLNTPITADSDGNLFFGTRVTGTAPAPLSTSQSLFVRIDGATGAATYVTCDSSAGNAAVSRVTSGSAPALSNDEQIVYVGMKGTSSVTAPHLVALDATSLAPINSVALVDPNSLNNANMNDISTASPMVAPDGDVFFGILANPQIGSRGWLLHFSGDLNTQYTPGAFGWDYTPGIVPASMVPSYTGTSSYLLFCKYNNYVSADGNGINTVAILDPNSTQTDFHSSALGMVEMRQVLTMISPSPDPEYPTYLGAAREWCINASAVNPVNGSVYFNNEDGHLYRWDLSANSLTEGIQLNTGVGQPYVPTAIGPDGTLFTLNGGYLYAIGSLADVSLTLVSDAQDVRYFVAGDSVTFTATASGNSGIPTGTITFEDTTIDSYGPNTAVLAVVPLDGSGQASFTTSSLDGGSASLGSNLGNHRIRATYSGDGTYGGGSIKLAQKLHAFESTTTGGATGTFEYGDAVAVSATVAKTLAGPEIPTGFVAFSEGGEVLAQHPLDSSGQTGFSISTLKPGVHTINAAYQSDTWFAASNGDAVFTVWEQTSTSGSSVSPTLYGQNATLSASVSAVDGTAGVPGGNVSFWEGATNLGSSAVDGSGNASLDISSLSVGSHTITAKFAGDSGWYDSDSSTFSHTVQAATSTTVSGSPNPSTYSSSVTFTATVTSVTGGAGVPTGSVTFKDGATSLGSSAVDSSGVAELSTSALQPGVHSITAEFTGSNGYLDSSGGTSQSVVGSTSTSLGSSPNPSNFGSAATFTATVTAAGGATGTPTGSVVFSEGTTVLGSVAVDGSGQAALDVSSLEPGDHTIDAAFQASGAWQGSSGSTTHTVGPDTTAPTAPTGVSTSAGPGKGQVTIQWNASTDPDDAVVSYQLWSSSKANGKFSLKATLSGTSYVDNTGPKKTRYYYVIAIDSHGNQSARSVIVSGTGAPRKQARP